MTFFQTYEEFILESQQFNKLKDQSIFNRMFSIYDQMVILEFFHEREGLWFCLFNLNSQLSRFLVSFDSRIQTMAHHWAQPKEISFKQQRCINVEIHDHFPKLRMEFSQPGESIIHFIYSGHPVRPYVQLKMGIQTLLSFGFHQEEQLNWKALPEPLITPWKDSVQQNPTQWKVIFDHIALPYSIKLTKAIHQKRNKIKHYDNDEKQHQLHILYNAFATHLLSLNYLEMPDDFFNFQGHSFPVYRHLSSGKNASIYFKKAKKSLLGLKALQHHRQQNDEEIVRFEKHLKLLEDASLAGLQQVKEFLIKEKLMGSEQKVKKEIQPIPKQNPYFVVIDGQKFSFGKNQLQNDTLTFQIAHKKDFFFHIDKQSGSHVILHHPNPSHDLILLACKLVLSLANLSDAEVTYTAMKYVRKTKILGLVKLEKSQTIKIKLGEENWQEILRSAKRY